MYKRQIVPGQSPLHRESVFLERAIAGERARLAMGLSLQPVQTRTLLTEGMDQAAIAEQYYEPPLVNIIPYACHACPTKQYLSLIHISLSVYSDGKCYFDGSAEEAAEVLPSLGADAVGLNCSSGPDQMGTVVRMMKKAAPDTPIAAKPNAGLPTITETGEAVYHMNPEDFARHMHALKADGANLLGGCCGTGPAYIEALRALR